MIAAWYLELFSASCFLSVWKAEPGSLTYPSLSRLAVLLQFISATWVLLR